MKVFGIIASIMGGFGLVFGLVYASESVISSGIVWLVIGIYCISKANKKEQERKERDNWLNNSGTKS